MSNCSGVVVVPNIERTCSILMFFSLSILFILSNTLSGHLKTKKSNFYLVVRLCTWTCGNQTSNQTAFERRDSYRTHYHVTKIVALSLMLDLVNESKQATTSNQMMQSVMAISAACKYMHSKSEQRF